LNFFHRPHLYNFKFFCIIFFRIRFVKYVVLLTPKPGAAKTVRASDAVIAIFAVGALLAILKVIAIVTARAIYAVVGQFAVLAKSAIRAKTVLARVVAIKTIFEIGARKTHVTISGNHNNIPIIGILTLARPMRDLWVL